MEDSLKRSAELPGLKHREDILIDSTPKDFNPHGCVTLLPFEQNNHCLQHFFSIDGA